MEIHGCMDICFYFPEYMPRTECGVIWQCVFNILGNGYTVIQSVCTMSHSYPWRVRVLASSQPQQHMLLSVTLGPAQCARLSHYRSDMCLSNYLRMLNTVYI